MNFLAILSALLVFFSIFSAYIVKNIYTLYMTDSAYIAQLSGNWHKSIADQDKAHIEQFRILCRAQQNKEEFDIQELENDENIQEKSERLSRYIHITSLFSLDESEKTSKRSKVEQKILERLIDTLYGTSDIFVRFEEILQTKPLAPALIQEILRARIQQQKDYIQATKKQKKRLFSEPKDIANLPLEPRWRKLFNIIFPETYSKIDHNEYSSLLSYLSFENKEKIIYVHLAPTEVLLAIFKNPHVVQNVISQSSANVQKLLTLARESKNNSQINTQAEKEVMEADFEKRFRSELIDGIDPEFISFKISTTKRTR